MGFKWGIKWWKVGFQGGIKWWKRGVSRGHKMMEKEGLKGASNGGMGFLKWALNHQHVYF